MSTQAAEQHEKAAVQYGATQMIRHFLQAVTFASAVIKAQL